MNEGDVAMNLLQKGQLTLAHACYGKKRVYLKTESGVKQRELVGEGHSSMFVRIYI